MNPQEAGNQNNKQDWPGKYLTFFLAEEEYGIEILKVHEITGLLPITRVPQTPEFIRGVVNLRGKVIPIMDARVKFGLPAVQETKETCIIVVHVRDLYVGVIVDRVSEVIDIPEGDIAPPPSFGPGFQTEHILGIAKTQHRVKILLNIDRILLAGELAQFKEPNAVTEKFVS